MTQKLKKLYCKKELTEVSGSTKLFGTFNSGFLSQSNIRDSIISHRSLFSPDSQLASNNLSMENLLPVKKLED